jgi:predicted phosphodiesterase
MKLALASDIHLEFGDIVLENKEKADILILAGDICVAKDCAKANYIGERFQAFFQRVSFQFPKVIYIMGNHEHYTGDFLNSKDLLQKMFDDLGLTNITLLEKETLTIDDVTFIGGTLWTNMNKRDPLTMWHAGQSMNDYKEIKNSAHGYSGGGYMSRLQPEDTLKDHDVMLDYIRQVVEGKLDQKFVVVGHHAPTFGSVSPAYQNDTLMNGNFYSDLTEFIMDRPQIKLWIHGHMHNNSDYMIKNTRVVCNPRGYFGYETRADYFELQYLEV